ncbi:hypothetical protein [Pelistega indica]|uniref:hypothetical protein n=1 Tax=Pelistega indica TaxID=1414851 RepID=UPI0004164827|nr:hypothetical protein [Pelistega indica]
MDKKQVVFLDDWENWFQGSIDIQPIREVAEVKFISKSLEGNELITALQKCNVLVLFRERTKITESILKQCKKLERIICTGVQNRNLDLKTAAELGIEVSYAKGGNSKDSTCEITWTLLLSAFKRLNLLTLSSSQPA